MLLAWKFKNSFLSLSQAFNYQTLQTFFWNLLDSEKIVLPFDPNTNANFW